MIDKFKDDNECNKLGIIGSYVYMLLRLVMLNIRLK